MIQIATIIALVLFTIGVLLIVGALFAGDAILHEFIVPIGIVFVLAAMIVAHGVSVGGVWMLDREVRELKYQQE